MYIYSKPAGNYEKLCESVISNSSAFSVNSSCHKLEKTTSLQYMHTH